MTFGRLSPLDLSSSRVTSVSIKSASTPHQPIASDPCTSHQGTILTQNGKILLVARALPCFVNRVAIQRRAAPFEMDRVPPCSALETVNAAEGQMFVSNAVDWLMRRVINFFRASPSSVRALSNIVYWTVPTKMANDSVRL